jgi:membrane protein required for colicin V production
MFIDVIVLGLLVLALIKGFSKGLVVAVFSFIAFIIGMAAAMKLSAAVANYLGSNINISQRWLPVIAFIIVFFIVVLLVRLGAKAIEAVMRTAMLGWVNRLGGIFFYGFLYLFIFSIVLFYSAQLHLLGEKTIKDSITYPILQPLAPKIIEGIATILPFFKNMFSALGDFFGNVATKVK